MDHNSPQCKDSTHVSGSVNRAVRALPLDLSVLSTPRLRALSDRFYRDLDVEHPPTGSLQAYRDIAAELDRRDAPAPVDRGARLSFRDNALFARFELFHDGTMAGYLHYEMRGGEVLLLNAVVDSRFPREAVEAALIESVLLNAHRRRLAVTPYGVQAREFLNAHPQYLGLLMPSQRVGFTRRAPSDSR